MSTFGKKALVKWEYSFDNTDNSNKSGAVNPLKFKPCKEFLREVKLEKLLNNGDTN